MIDERSRNTPKMGRLTRIVITNVRDTGGLAFALKRAIDEGLVAGPRVWPSGALISITGGHGDFRQLTELPRESSAPLARMETIGGSAIADDHGTVRKRVREQLMQGASQVKLTAGGGVASPHSPLDIATFTGDELRAAVEAAISFPPGSLQQLKQQAEVAGTDRSYTLARTHGVKLAFGTDTLFSEALARRQGAQLAKLER